MVGTGREVGPLPAVHLTADEGAQSYTEPYPRVSRDGSNLGPFIPGRSVVHVTEVRGEWACVVVDDSPVGWVRGSELVPPMGPQGRVAAAVRPSSPPPATYAGMGLRPVGNGMAVTALVLGILATAFSFNFFYIGLGVVLGILAIVFGAVGLHRSRTYGAPGGQAVAGLILGLYGAVASGHTYWAIHNLTRSIGVSVSRLPPVVIADPTTNRMTMDRCFTQGQATAQGTLVNTSAHRETFTVLVTFYGPAGKQDATGEDDAVAPGASSRWTVNTQVAQPVSSCSFQLYPYPSVVSNPQAIVATPSTLPAEANH